MFITVIIIISFLTGFVIFRKVEVKDYQVSSKFLNPFYKISISLIEVVFQTKSEIIKKNFLKPHLMDSLRKINPTDRSCKHIKKYFVEKIALCLVVVFVGCILAIVVTLSQSNEHMIVDEKYLEKGNYAEGQKSRRLGVSVEDKIDDQEINIEIDSQQLTEEEVFELFKEVEEQIDASLLGKNSSLMEVRSDLRLPARIEGKPVKIVWETNNYEVLGTDGKVNNDDLEEKGAPVTLTATLTYQNYSQSYDIQVNVMPPILSEAEQLINNILEKIKLLNQNKSTDKYLELPQSINGKLISWSEKKENTGGVVLILGFIAAIIIYYSKDKDLEEKVKKREKQLLSDYPNLVSKLTLLLGAGMTVKGAWQKLVLDYREKKETDPKYYRYAYEEMLITYYEMLSGASEIKAYEEFGKRCKNQRYIKLSALITQNLRKGSRGLSKILERESFDAFEERKAYAKTIGEEAGTKLMVPMFLNLILVLVMIMIPACMSFQM